MQTKNIGFQWTVHNIHSDMCPLFQKYFQQEVHSEKWETVFKNCPLDFINRLKVKKIERLDQLNQRLVDGVSKKTIVHLQNEKCSSC